MTYIEKKRQVGFFAVAAIVVGAAVSVYSSNQQAKASKNAANAQREATAAQGRQSSVEAQKERIRQQREARIRRGAIISSGVNSGLGSGSSGIGGSIGSVATQMAENIGTINQTQTFAQETGTALQKAADYNVKAQKWQAIGQIGQSIFSAGTGAYGNMGKGK